jgi:hypothetical protein
MRTKATVPAPIQGISQQAPSARRPDQVGDSINAFPHPVFGAIKRPGTIYAGQVDPSIRVLWSVRNAGVDTENRLVGFAPTTARLFVYRVEGSALVEEPVTTSADAQEYLSDLPAENAQSYLRTTYLDDRLIICNRTWTVRMKVPPPPAPPTIEGPTVYTLKDHTLVWVKAAAYQTKYKITVDSWTGEFTTSATDPATTTISNIALQLRDALLANMGPLVATNYEIVLDQNIIAIRSTRGLTVSVTSSDTGPGINTAVIGTRVQRFADLPPRASSGKVVQIAASADTGAGSYYVKFSTESSGLIGTGVWEEDAGPGLLTELDATTMPVGLSQNADGSWTCDVISWAPRRAGDEDTCATPSFVGDQIYGLTLFRNRLCFITRSSLSCSRAGVFYDFWKTSATRNTDDDRIDLTVTHPQKSSLFDAVPFDNDLLLIGTSAQFVVAGGDIFTSKTAAARFRSAVDLSLLPRPFSAGPNVYAVGFGLASVYEFARTTDTASAQALYITAHVPNLLSGTRDTAVCEAAHCAFLWNGTNKVVCYKFLFDGAEKLQSAWSFFQFSGAVESIATTPDTAFILVRTASQLRVEALPLSETVLAPTAYTPSNLYIDCKILGSDSRILSVTSIGGGGTGVTSITTPFAAASTVAYTATGARVPDQTVTTSTISTRLAFPPDSAKDSGDYVLGIPFGYRLSLTPPFVRDAEGKASLGGYLAVSEYSLLYQYTTRFDVTVEYTNAVVPPTTQVVEPKSKTDFWAIDDTVSPQIHQGTTEVYIGGSNQITVTITDSSPYCCSILGYSWTGAYFA